MRPKIRCRLDGTTDKQHTEAGSLIFNKTSMEKQQAAKDGRSMDQAGGNTSIYQAGGSRGTHDRDEEAMPSKEKMEGQCCFDGEVLLRWRSVASMEKIEGFRVIEGFRARWRRLRDLEFTIEFRKLG
jgi:hypothetical protein